jgi:hypothetical protein
MPSRVLEGVTLPAPEDGVRWRNIGKAHGNPQGWTCRFGGTTGFGYCFGRRPPDARHASMVSNAVKFLVRS